MTALFNVPAMSFVVIIVFSFLFSAKAKAQVYSGISVQNFYDELSPYGRWVHNPEYGYVWLPDVERGFQPYATRGYWVMTEYGNTWVSDYVWGWAPFHYGRWFYDNYYGWAWVPGTEWGPAWVNWRSSNGYYGWAPLTPGFHVHMSVNLPLDYWVFVPYRYITSPRIYNYYVPRRRVVHVYHQSVVINNFYTTNNYTYISGPSRNDIERTTRRQVLVRNVDNSPRPDRTVVKRNSVQIYRPAVTENTRTARPSRVADNQVQEKRDAQQRRTSGTNQESNQLNNPYTRRSNVSGNTTPERRTSAGSNEETIQRRSSVQERSGNNNENAQRQYVPSRRSERDEPEQNRTAPSQPTQRTQESSGRSTERRVENEGVQYPAQRSHDRSNEAEMRRSSAPPSTERRQQAQPQQQVERRSESRTPSSSGRQESYSPAPQQRREVRQPSETRTSSGSQQQAPARQRQDTPSRSSGRSTN